MPNWTSVYPGNLDSTSNMPNIVDGVDLMYASHINSVRNAVLQLEHAVGSDAEESGTVRRRVSDLEAATGSPTPPSGIAGGDLGGSYPNPTVDGLQGVPVDSATPSTSEVLSYDGTKWTPTAPGAPSTHTLGGLSHTVDTLANLNTKISDATLDDSSSSRPPSGTASGDLSGSYPNPTVSKIQGQTITSGVPSEGDVLKYTGGQWQHLPVSSSLNDLADVKVTAPVDGYFIQYNSTAGQFLGEVLNLDDAFDTNISSPSNGDVLQYNGSKWVNGVVAIDDLTDIKVTSPTDGYFVQYNPNAAEFLGRVLELGSAMNVDVPSPTNGYVLTYVSASGKWEAVAPTGGANTLDNLLDVKVTSPQDGYFIQYNSSAAEFLGKILTLNSAVDVDASTPSDEQVLTYINASGKWEARSPNTGNTLEQAYNQGGAGFGRSIIVDSGPIAIEAFGDAAIEMDGYVAFGEIADPSALVGAGLLYTKDDGGDTELFYKDDYGNAVQITEDGYLATLNRTLVFSDDSESTEAGGTFVTQKTFRIVRDSANKQRLWRLVVEIWRDGGVGNAECRLQAVGSGGTDSSTTSSAASASGDTALQAIDVPINDLNEPVDTFITINIQLRATGGATNSHIKYTDLYAVY